jgi:hypothetical protein
VGPGTGLDSAEKKKISCPLRLIDPLFRVRLAFSIVSINTGQFWLREILRSVRN